jgi:hypothetical protein
MKKENVKSPIKAPQDDRDSWVDVHDDALMIELGIRPPHATPRDPSVWTKSKQEKKILRTLRCAHKGRMHFGTLLARQFLYELSSLFSLRRTNDSRIQHILLPVVCIR